MAAHMEANQVLAIVVPSERQDAMKRSKVLARRQICRSGPLPGGRGMRRPMPSGALGGWLQAWVKRDSLVCTPWVLLWENLREARTTVGREPLGIDVSERGLEPTFTSLMRTAGSGRNGS
jgi:hypothetical protein